MNVDVFGVQEAAHVLERITVHDTLGDVSYLQLIVETKEGSVTPWICRFQNEISFGPASWPDTDILLGDMPSNAPQERPFWTIVPGERAIEIHVRRASPYDAIILRTSAGHIDKIAVRPGSTSILRPFDKIDLGRNHKAIVNIVDEPSKDDVSLTDGPISQEEFVEAKSSEKKTRRIAHNPSLTHAQFRHLSFSPDRETIQRLAQNSSLPSDLLKALAVSFPRDVLQNPMTKILQSLDPYLEEGWPLQIRVLAGFQDALPVSR
jgi:hypothetical protein